MSYVGVTGAEGFIGSHLVEELLSAGHRVKALVQYNSFGSTGWLSHLAENSDLEIVFGDIRDPQATASFASGLNTVYHLASLIAIPYSFQAPSSYLQTNVLGTQTVLQACLDEGVNRVIHTSTSEVYGSAQYVPQDERHPLVGQSPYAASKIGADQVAYSYYSTFGLNVTTIRPFNQFGPRQSARAIIPTLILQALSGQDIFAGEIESTRDFGFVEETVKAFHAIANSNEVAGEVFNVGTGSEISIGEVARMTLELANSSASLVLDTERLRPKNAEVWRLCADSTKLLSRFPELSRLRNQDFEKNLERTFDWYKSNGDKVTVNPRKFQV